jgi:hypothetical protein
MAKTSKRPAGTTIIDTMDTVLGNEFQGPSWDRWRAILKGAYALPMTDAERELFVEVADGSRRRRRSKSCGLSAAGAAAKIRSPA